ncbi:MAG: hypothetical protein GC149_05130 [Gammaproteobacteria bacterium]|nr:hypothetical protein [Gammaproteobacteria bacterium]
MIHLLRAIFISSLVLTMTGCAFLNSFDSDLDKQIDVWMAQHEYGKILDTLRYVRPSNAKYPLLQKKRQQAIEEARRFEQEKIATSLNEIEKGQWHDAEVTLTDALAKLPDSKALHATYQEFLRQRAQYLKSLYMQLSINKAEWLVKDRPIQQQLKRTLPEDKKTQAAMDDYGKDSQEIYQQMLECGNNAAATDDLELAQRCYQLAYKLQPDTKIKTTLANIQEKLERKHLPPPQTHEKQPALSQLGRNLLDKSKKDLEAGHLKQAIDHYDRIPLADKRLAAVKAYGEEIKRRVRDNVSQGIELGRKLYSQGQVEQALAVWNKLRELDPDNENLLSHIDRAERVLEKVQQLRREQSPDSQPAPSNNGQ